MYSTGLLEIDEEEERERLHLYVQFIDKINHKYIYCFTLPPIIQLEDENHREFFRNHELWRASNSETFERHNASARYYTGKLLNSFNRELFDSIPWRIEADESKALPFTEASLFGYLLEGLDPVIYKTAKKILDLQPNLTRRESLDTLQQLFEENKESALAIRAHNQNLWFRRSSNRHSRRFSPRSPFRDSNNRNETCYICSGMNHHARNCKYRHIVRKYGERIPLQDKAKEQTR
ncbi:hypothetical protein OnM2_039009 [Erysiphe neolycopersici]|uniref:Uncharacterized protein n=1 Tax=Erysiphe neolycopersici TaxID=212602 RepID=A0A420HWE4_9PEZI|nr:hypothetical protein OnM2_039009 [Erysiphe neolycopersici]